MNLPIHIADEEDSLVYTYGAGNNRIKARLFRGGQLVRTTWYGDNFERVVEGSSEKFHHWILSPDGPLALVVTVTGGSTTYYYLCSDHLNSITGIMDASGKMLEEYSYDPWGRRRSPEDWLTTDVTAPVITTRGYTGHEHLDAFGLIHMNGRIYDPHLGRILNPDPIIQEPLNIQNYNRYSYCLNNPLRYTDPSGYSLYKLYMDRVYGEGNYYYRGNGPKLLSFEDYMTSGTVGGAGNGSYGLPYQGHNGSGDRGFYYDYYSGRYISTETGARLSDITHLVYSYGPNLPTIFRGVVFRDGSSWYTEDGPLQSGASSGDGDIFNWGIPIGAAGTTISTGTEYAENRVRTSFKTGRSPVTWRKLTPRQQAWRTANVLGRNAKFVKYAKGAGVIGTGISVGMAGYDIASGEGTTIDYFDVGVGTASIGAAIFLASNPVGWVIGTVAAVYFAGRLVYDIYEEVND